MKYFVSYAYFISQTGGHGFGNIEADRSWPIPGTEDIQELTEHITESLRRAMNRRDVTLTIIGWQPFEPEIERKRPAPGDSGNVVKLRTIGPSE